MTTPNLYDFNDVSDLPEALAARMTSPGGVVNPLVAILLDIVTAANGAGVKVLTMRQIETIAFRMDIDVKSQQSLRTALNVSVLAGNLVKPTRQSYSLPGLPVEVPTSTPVEPEAEVVPVDATDDTDADPLA